MFNFHALLHSETSDSLSARLEPDRKACAQLDTAAEALVRALRHRLPLVSQTLGTAAAAGTPRFRLQGSVVYETSVSPAHPGQHIDLDLGLYLPETFLASLVGSQHALSPSAARAYFTLMDRLLSQICYEHGWEYPAEHRQRPHCCRIFLRERYGLHIDLPLYVSPATDFSLAPRRWEFSHQSVGDHYQSTFIACRDGTWKESDVRCAIDRYGSALSSSPQPDALRRQWRYLKAWRDFNWKGGNGPPSILLMEASSRVCSEPNLRTLLAKQQGCDDLIVKEIFRRLGHSLRAPVLVHWGKDKENLSRGASPLRRQSWAVKARDAALLLRDAHYAKHASGVIDRVTQVFGGRVPSSHASLHYSPGLSRHVG